MQLEFYEILGWVGAAFLLISFFFVTFLHKKTTSFPNLSLNILGASFLIINAYYDKSYAFVMLNVFWVLVGIFTLKSKLFKLSTSKKHLFMKDKYNKFKERISFSKDLHIDESFAEEHIRKMKELIKNNEEYQVFLHMYDCLNILDTKNQSLMAVNSLVLAVILFFVPFRDLEFILILFNSLGLILLLFSSFLLLYNFTFLKWVSTDDLDKDNYDKTFAFLLIIRDSRTKRYRISVWLSLLSALMFILSFMLKLLISLFI